MLTFTHCNIHVALWDAKACHFQYYKYLLQILLLMLSLKRKEALLRVQCTGDFCQYFSSKVKCYMLPGYCSLHSMESSLFSLFKNAWAFSTLKTKSVNSNVAWDVRLWTLSSVPYVEMLSVREKCVRMNADALLWASVCWSSACLSKRWRMKLCAGVQTSRSHGWTSMFLPYSWPLKNQWDWALTFP